MGRPKKLIPSMCHHTASGQMCVHIDGKTIYLGKSGTHQAIINYRRAIGDLAYEQAHKEITAHIESLKEVRRQAEDTVYDLRRQIELVDKELELLQWKADSYMLKDPQYPKPPAPFGKLGFVSLPDIPCIYFLHNENGIEYVGKTECLRNRFGAMCADRHHAARDTDEISWIEFPSGKLEYIECYYIWLLKPMRNFGNDKATEYAIAVR